MSRIAQYALGLVVAAALVWLALVAKTGQRGWVEVRADQVAVVSDYVLGGSTVVDTPGVRWFVPYFQDVHVLDKGPALLSLRGDTPQGAREAPALQVRAADGTGFSFEDLELRYQLAPALAAEVLRDSGAADEGRLRLVRALARGVLRDELGRSTCEEIVRGDVLDQARAAARERLNAHLGPHGVILLEVPAATPRFDAAYEQQVLRRRVAEQQVELVRAERRKLAMQLEQRRATVLRAKEVERAVLLGELERQRLEAETAAIRARREADVYHLERLEEARVARLELEARSRARRAGYAREVEGFAERVRAVAARGEAAVREAWVEALGGIELELVPYELAPPGRWGGEAAR